METLLAVDDAEAEYVAAVAEDPEAFLQVEVRRPETMVTRTCTGTSASTPVTAPALQARARLRCVRWRRGRTATRGPG